MRKTLLALSALVAVGAAVLLWVMREDVAATGADAAALAPASTDPRGGSESVSGSATGKDGGRAEAKIVPDRDREQAIRVKVNRILEGYPEVARVTDIRCDGSRCRVEMEAVDLERAAPVRERVAAPGQGFAEDARELRLEMPIALGMDGGPYRVAFTLTF